MLFQERLKAANAKAAEVKLNDPFAASLHNFAKQEARQFLPDKPIPKII